MRVFSLLALLTLAALSSIKPLAAQCMPEMLISVYTDDDFSSDALTVFAYASTVDNSTLCSCIHSSYLSAVWLDTPLGSMEGWDWGDSSSVSTPTDDADGNYYAIGAATLNCSCAGALGTGEGPIPIPPPPPTITGIADALSWETTIYPGASSYLAIFGTALTALGQTPTPTVTGDSDVTISSVSYAADAQVNVTYTVAANPAMGPHTISLQTVGGIASFQIPVGCAIPTNFHQYGPGADIGGGTLQFFYTWSSSTGNRNDLQACGLGESVYYNTTLPSYVFPAPFPPDSNPNPTTTIPPVPGTDPGFQDQHSTLGTFIKPYFSNSDTAQQQYQWQCTCSANNAWQAWPGYTGINIIRSVSPVPPPSVLWYFLITKSGASATINPLP